MKSLQLGLIVALVVIALFGSTLWVMAQSAPSDPQPTIETSASQAVGVIVTATVGTTSGTCASATTAFVRANANTTVFYCFTVRHTGVAGDEPLTIHNVQMSRRGLSQGLPSSFTLNPGETRTTVQSQLIFTDSTNVSVTNFVTWTAQTSANGAQFFDTSQARIVVVNPSVNVVKTVGQDRTSCPTARNVRVPSGQGVAFCISIQNTGDITFTRHTISDPPLSINATINYTLAPGEFLRLYPTNLQGLTAGSLERTITAAFPNNVSYTGFAANDITVTGTSTATVDIGTSTVRITKTVSTQPEDCSKSNTITLNPGTMVYYCVIIQNTGVVTLTQHRLTENYLSIDVSFNHPLRPGERLNVTNDFLARNGQPIVFGPFEVHPKYGVNDTIENTMNYTGVSPDGFSATASGGATVTYPPTPTSTHTSRPDDTSTPTPFPTGTPTLTPIPQSPTPTVTPTFTPITPSPTPTRSYAISLLQTPTPRTQAANIPSVPQQQDPAQQAPTIDPNLPTPLPPDQQLPVQDPILATATQIAVDATATVIAAEATAAQVAIDSAAATALAESQAPIPESPLPTPTIDPSLQDPNQAGLPVVPGSETPTETPTTFSTETLPVETAQPGDDVTVLPPLVTAEIATETPAVVVLVVTNTPEAGAVLPEGQRPIVPPTPTPTPDFVMAAARTFDIAVTTMGWLWFLIGSLVFFVTAGIVAGLFFRQSEASRFELPQPDYWLEEEPQAARSRPSPPTGQSADDEWPADLP